MRKIRYMFVGLLTLILLFAGNSFSGEMAWGDDEDRTDGGTMGYVQGNGLIGSFS